MNARKAGRGVLLTGGSGYVGGLIASVLLVHEDVHLLVPVRRGIERAKFLEPIEAEIRLSGHELTEELASRIQLVELPPVDRLQELDAVVAEHGLTEIIHSAGCLDYFNAGALEAVNVELTRGFVELAKRCRLERFIFISTAFSSGYVWREIEESLHVLPGKDPTDYTRTKRDAEHIVAGSGMKYQILRPAIIIGDSRDGHYSGKQYGLYQLWSGMERLLCREWHPEMHVLAPRQPVQLVHQDAFQSAFLAAYRHLPANTIVNIVSDQETLPDLRALWDLWLDACLRPRSTFYYERMADIPLREINGKQRALLALASVNLQIASHPWRFETTSMEWLRQKGMAFTDATTGTVSLCQDVFIAESKQIQEFLGTQRELFADEMTQIEIRPPAVPVPTGAAHVADSV